MAEVTIVGFVLGKLANIIENEIKFLGGVGEKVKRVQRELTRIQCCLRDVDKKRNGVTGVQNWLNELRDVAYQIEDTTDTFFLEVEDRNKNNPNFFQNNPGLLQKLKNLLCLCEKPQKVLILHKLGRELDDILNILVEIDTSRERYGIQNLQDIVVETVRIPIRRAAYQDVDENEVVGLQADRENILQLLLDKNTKRRIVITIVGVGGLGKTTLAHLVYRRLYLKRAEKDTDPKPDFDYHIMIPISQQFSLTDLLTKMLHRLGFKPENQDEETLIHELRRRLKDVKYLIILDDVWQVDLWSQLKFALPDENNGSRVLITSRSSDVATKADPGIKPYKLRFLDDKESQQLLLKKAFPYREPGEKLGSDLLKLADELSEKCKGLPLALIVVGGILATKDPTKHAWERVLRTMNWHVEGKNCMDVLAMSYDNLPYYLKPCFLYLSSFPEDYEISAICLIKMWIAEGFIQRVGTTTMEETAENYLEELFQRSMIHVSSRSKHGLINSCKVHDFLRDLAINLAKKENFFTIFSEESDVHQPNGQIRRASFQSNQPQSMKYLGPNTRTILMFKYLPGWTNLKLLKVLYLVGVKNFNDDLLKGLENLIHLKYLSITNCEINFSFDLRHMKALETLDMRGELPENFTFKPNLFPPHFHTLQLHSSHLLHDPMPELGKLKSLSTLCFGPDAIIYWGSLVCPAGFPVLRYLKVDDPYIESLVVAEGVMPQLTSLEVSGNIGLDLPPGLEHNFL